MRTFRPSARRAARRLARPSALALFAVAASGAALATPAQAAEKRTTFACIYPYLSGAQPISVVASGSFSPSAPYVGQAFSLFVRTTSTFSPTPAGIIGADSVEVRSTSISLSTTSGPMITSPARQDASGTYTSDFKVAMPPGTGHYPVSASLGRIGFTLILRDANGVPIEIDQTSTPVPQTDDNPETLQIECALAPAGQDTLLAATFFGDPGPPTPQPTPPPATPIPTPFVTPSPSPTPIAPPTPTPTPEPTPIAPPTPSPTPEPTTIAPPTLSPTPIAPPTPSPSPTGFPCSPIALRYVYDVSGTASVKTLTKGSVPLTGETTLSSFCGAPGAVPLSGPITFAPATANLTALGFLPVSAKVALVATEPLAGSAPISAPGTGAITLSTKVRIKLPSVKTFGIELAGGANCQAKQVSALTLKNTQSSFTMASGGPVAGMFSISDLSGCGFLTGIVSPLTSGSGNLIALNLTPRPLPAA